MDASFSSSYTELQTSWTGFQDYESGISHYIITIFHQSDSSNRHMEIYSERVGGMESEFVRSNFRFQNGDSVIVEVAGVNGAGARVSVNSSGVIVDVTPPEVTALADGQNPSDDLEYQSDNSTLQVAWEAVDPESGLERILVNAYELREGQRRRVWPPPPGPSSNMGVAGEPVPADRTWWNITGLELNSGSRYFFSVTFVNFAGLEVVHETDGVVVDLTPPVVMSVSVSSDAYIDTGDTGDSVAVIADPSQVEARWRAFDVESGIGSYLVGIVDENRTLVSPDYTRFEGEVRGGMIRTAGLLTIGRVYSIAVSAENNAGGVSEPALAGFRYMHNTYMWRSCPL